MESQTVVGDIYVSKGFAIDYHVFYRNGLPDGEYNLMAVKKSNAK